MQYGSVIQGRFLSRPDRFIARVEIAGTETVVHVKNTGRCRELPVPGCAVTPDAMSIRKQLSAVRETEGSK